MVNAPAPTNLGDRRRAAGFEFGSDLERCAPGASRQQYVNQPIDFERHDLVGVAFSPGVGLGLARGEDRWAIETPDPLAWFGELAASSDPRWAWWGTETTSLVASAGIGIDRCWDILVVHRLFTGGWRTSIGEVWAELHGLPLETLPKMGQLGLLDAPCLLYTSPSPRD